MVVWIFSCPQQRERPLVLLKCLPCPHCRHCGALNRHGYLRGYDQRNTHHKTVRALRVYCSNRGHSQGCGRTFSLWIADKVRRLFLSTDQLWRFLEQTSLTGNKSRSFENIGSPLTKSAAFGIWKRFLKAQSRIRTALLSICAPPKQTLHCTGFSAAQNTIAHLQEAFKDSFPDLNPIAAFQAKTQSFLI